MEGNINNLDKIVIKTKLSSTVIELLELIVLDSTRELDSTTFLDSKIELDSTKVIDFTKALNFTIVLDSQRS